MKFWNGNSKTFCLDSLAHKYNAGPLKSFALAMISRNVEEVMRTRGWKELILSEQVNITNFPL